MNTPKRGSDSVEVHGLSNYHCKLLSPLFTYYGMDKSGSPRLLNELGHGESADCGRLLSHRAFLISPEHIDIFGYGKDQSGGVEYLRDMLDIIKTYHNGEERLIPIHADGDGHCLVHALSRATTGREIFWHALRDNLVNHLGRNLKTYQDLFRDFIDIDDWRTIIDEAHPYHVSSDGFSIGLGNIHIFALANVLRRPVVLLDSLEGMKNVADYSAVFVPALVDPAHCRGNFPLCIAWSGSGHNHFIPLVGVMGRPLPTIPASLIPNTWRIEKSEAMQYLTLNSDGSLTVAGGKPLQDGYLFRLVAAMRTVFLERYSISADLVSDMHLYAYQHAGSIGLHPDVAIERTRDAVSKNKVFRCLVCNALCQADFDEGSLQPGGYLFSIMLQCHDKPRAGVIYNFPMEELQCKYDTKKNCLVPHQFPCMWCKNKRLRLVNHYGDIQYVDGDLTPTPSQAEGSCCGYKHFWAGQEYDNLPKQFTVDITLKGKAIEEKITWFYGDSCPSLNSDAMEIAHRLAEKYFGSDTNLDEHSEKIAKAIISKLSEFDLCNDSDQRSSRRRIHARDADVSSATKEAAVSSMQKEHMGEASDPKTIEVLSLPPTRCLQAPRLKSMATNNSEGPNSDLKPGKARIRICISDGRQQVCEVQPDLDYAGLQNLVHDLFGILPSRQVLKLGFPPKPLGASFDLKNGERLTVEILKERLGQTELKQLKTQEAVNHSTTSKKGENDDLVVGHLQSFVDLLQDSFDHSSRKHLLQSGDIDGALDAITKMVRITGKSSVWEYAICHPELFSPGGVFYEQFRRDIGLIHGRHCMLPLIPGRVFRYNGDSGRDRIELCLEPTGHFQVGPGISDIIERIAAENDPFPATCASLRHGALTTDSMAGPLDVRNTDNYEGVSGCDADRAKTAPKNKQQKVGLEACESQPTRELVENKNAEAKVAPGYTQPTGELVENKDAEAKVAPGYTIVGSKPTDVTPEEVAIRRQRLVEVLKSKR